MRRSHAAALGVALLLAGSGAAARDLVTGAVVANQGERVTCTAVLLGKKAADVSVIGVDQDGFEFDQPCPATPPGGICSIDITAGQDGRLTYCRAAGSPKKLRLAATNQDTGATSDGR